MAQAEGTDPLTMNVRAGTKERQWLRVKYNQQKTSHLSTLTSHLSFLSPENNSNKTRISEKVEECNDEILLRRGRKKEVLSS
jgi:hypothetical protein